MIKLNLIIAIAVFLGGCASHKLTNEQVDEVSGNELFQIYIDENGTYLDPVSQQSCIEQARKEQACEEGGNFLDLASQQACDRNLINPASQRALELKCEKEEEDYVKQIIRNFEKLKDKNDGLTLTIFIHGGLNAFDDATDKVDSVKA